VWFAGQESVSHDSLPALARREAAASGWSMTVSGATFQKVLKHSDVAANSTERFSSILGILRVGSSRRAAHPIIAAASAARTAASRLRFCANDPCGTRRALLGRPRPSVTC
jgi:hypothetical protein